MQRTQLLKLLVGTESPSHDKVAVDRVGAIVAEEARKLGAQVEIIPNQETGDHVLARFLARTEGGKLGASGAVEASGKDSILLLCHMDTVFPLGSIQKTPYREEGEKIFGPGTSDMKAGIVIALAGIDLRSLLHEIRVPTLHITASLDRIVSARLSNEVTNGLANSYGKTIEGPHLLLQARPKQCAAAITQFVRQL